MLQSFYKKIFGIVSVSLFLLAFSFAMKVEDIKAKDYVTDYTNTLSQEQVLEISKVLGQVEKDKGYQVAVVIVPNLDGDYIEHFAVKLYEKFGLGTKEKDEGALFLISKDTHEMRIEVGYGLEPVLTDGTTKYILDNVVRPDFKKGDYFSGIKNGVEGIKKVLDNGQPIQAEGRDSYSGNGNWFGIIIFIFVFLINILGWLFAIMARTKSWWLGGVVTFVIGFPILYFVFGLNPIGDFILFIFTITGFIFDYFISKSYKYWENKFKIGDRGVGPNPPWWTGGGFGPGGGFGSNSGSGFGGFGGGGMSGGGGSSSSW